MEVEQACDVFKRFNHQLEDGQVLHRGEFQVGCKGYTLFYT